MNPSENPAPKKIKIKVLRKKEKPVVESSPLIPDYLAKRNPHPRDVNISFEEGPHIYTVLGERGTYTSVTTWVHQQFPHFDQNSIIDRILKSSKRNDPTYKYYGKTREDIEAEWEANRLAASSAGTKMHYDIECYYNSRKPTVSSDAPSLNKGDFLEDASGDGVICKNLYNIENMDCRINNTSIEFKYFGRFVRDFPQLEAYRTEWMVYHEELKISGSIDMVFRDTRDGAFYIYDWKRSKEIKYDDEWCDYATGACLKGIPNLNFWHYSLQLGIYRAILEEKYGIKIAGMFLVVIHPDHDGYMRLETADLTREIGALFEERKVNICKI